VSRNKIKHIIILHSLKQQVNVYVNNNVSK